MSFKEVLELDKDKMAKLHKEGTITKNGTQGYIARMKNPKTNKFISKRAKTKDQALQKLLEITHHIFRIR